MGRLSGKNAIITGCNRGIGKAILEEFASEGANIWALTRHFSDEVEKEWKNLESKYNVSIDRIQYDLESEESIKNAIKSVLHDRKSIDILVNNAGVPHSGMLSMTSIAEARSIMEKNFFVPMMLVQSFSRQMIRQKHGVIINIVSIGGIETHDGFFAYGSSKAALAWATQSVSKELGRFGIRVNGIAPGLTDTQLGVGMHSELQIQETLNLNTIKRMARPEEIAKTALFLASDDSSFITGQIIKVDGGR